MTQEEKNLLLQDISARLPYGVFVSNTAGSRNIYGYLVEVDITYKCVLIDTDLIAHNSEKREFSPIEDVNPYLRPMSSMTKDEAKEWNQLLPSDDWHIGDLIIFDWLNKHHFDYRGLIEKDLALPAPEGMYKLNNQK